jgi:hypothetical protein
MKPRDEREAFVHQDTGIAVVSEFGRAQNTK